MEPNGTNPLGLDPMLLAAAYYGSAALESEIASDFLPDPNADSESGCPVVKRLCGHFAVEMKCVHLRPALDSHPTHSRRCRGGSSCGAGLPGELLV